jgi:hypothetical protein
MPTQTIQLSSLTGGVNRAQAREKQPAGTVFDALNVLPFDRSGRLRVGQRTGTATLLSGVSSGSVNGLIQVTEGQAETSGGSTVYSEPFTYANGNLTGNGGWLTNGASSTWVVSSNSIHVNGAASTSNYNLTALASLDISASYTIDFDLTIANIASSRPTFQITGEADNANPDNLLGNYVVRFDGGTDAGGTDTTVGITDKNFTDTDSLQFTCGPGTHHFTITITAARVCTVNVDGVDRVTASVPIDSTAFKTLRIFGNSSNLGTDIVLDTLAVATTGTPGNPRSIKLIAAANGEIWWGTVTSLAQVASGLAARRPCMTDISGYVIYVNGTQTKQLVVSTGVVSNITPTTTAAIPTLCRGCRTWRGRLVLFGQTADAQNFFMSRSGDPFDFDFSQEDPAAAFAGNASDAGRVGDVINDMIPWNADKLVIGCDHSMWLMDGDPTDGGAIVPISNGLGLLGREAWCIAPDGSLYFAGSNGLYRMTPGSQTPEPISNDKYPQFFAALNRGTNYFSMAWDRDRHGCYLFVTAVATGASTHLWYDLRTDGLWPIQYPDNHGPMAALVYDGDGASDRVLMLGGRDGKIRTVQQTGRTDDGTAISAYIVAGPFRPFPDAAILTGTTLDFGDLASADVGTSRWDATVTLRGGPDAYEVTEGSPHTSAVIAIGNLDRRSKTFRQRVRGGWFAVKIANSVSGDYFSVEDGSLDFEPAGKLRERR